MTIYLEWHWIPFVVVVVLLLVGILKPRESMDFGGAFLFLLLIAFIFIWGGIFWW